MATVKQQIIQLDNQLPIYIETGKLARQADGSVTVRQGNCILLATVCANKEPKEGQDFFPLSVDYMEKFSSAGRIPGSFHKREGKLTDYEVLISRLIDRALRPLFPEDYFCDVQILVSLISSDADIMPDSLACLAAAAALAVSDIPITEYISEVRVAKIDGKYVINPKRSALEKATMDFIIGGSYKNLVMVEGEAKECSEEELIEAIDLAHIDIKKQIDGILALRQQVGITQNRDYPKPLHNDAVKQQVVEYSQKALLEASRSKLTKQERSERFKETFKNLLEANAQWTDEEKELAEKYYDVLQWEVVRNMVLDEKVRLDGRSLTEIRPLSMETDYLPSPHGSALFTRGETQSLTTVTLGNKLDELMIDTAYKSEYTKLILHYNFPPFSTGEIKPMRGPGRREVGHGNLALRSLKQLVPTDIPYTIRIVSDILESNGSSSMATVCAGSLSLMDAGVPFKKHVGGIAMGLITRQTDKKYAILSDILGDEDHLGDMDFKVTGTRDGICGVQMDIKIDGLSRDLLKEALAQAKNGRLHILNAMYDCIPQHREDFKPHTPRIIGLSIEKEFIGAIIGPGGKIIQEIQRETGTTITIEEKNNKGEVAIFSANKEGALKAKKWIEDIVRVPKVGEVYEAVVKAIQPYGAFVEFLPGKQGLLHISEVDWKRLESLEGVLKENDVIQVKLLDVDEKTGKFKLSRKALLERK